MIDLYTWPTPNGHKIHIMLEETGLKYNVIPVDIRAGDQFKPEYLKINPNNKMPTIVDPDGPGGKRFPLMESGAILIYLAEKTGKFLPTEAVARYTALQWLFFQIAHVGPMLGQAHHFRDAAPEKIQYAINRYTNEAKRIYGVINKRLQDAPFMAGDYSIADMAIFPWLRSYEKQGVAIEEYPTLKRWFDTIAARPAVQRAVKVLADKSTPKPLDEKTRAIMYGDQQYARR
ncbi:MAG: glutathione S-transferase family protein [Rhodospirillales bacterium]|nr:glutathione S-transferase family protein [Rhodospirillales bacterium]